MSAEEDLGEFLDVAVSTVISQPGGTPDPVSGVTAAPDGGGIRLGRYTTLKLLGKGGMAEVYLAKQDGPAGFEKTCVVKRMRRVLAEEQRFIDMFLREARVAARLNHANIVQIFELCEEQGEYFIAMEYLDGISLHRAARRCWANDTSMPMEVVLRAVADAAQGLHHAHILRNREGEASSLVHRDISPDNLVVTRDGITKVLDFGIAKSDDDKEMVTRTGELKGKIPYMSPEQIRGDDLDGRADLWSLGVTLYWLLTGQRPFDGGSDHMTIDHILRQEPANPREVNPLIPAEVARLLMQLLEKDRNKRLSSGAELHDRLVALLGPSAGTSACSNFANEVLSMPANERAIAPGSVLTIIAARPETKWLRRVSESDEGQLASLIPEVGDAAGYDVGVPDDAPTLPMTPLLGAQDPDTGNTITGLNTAEIQSLAQPPMKRVVPVAAGLLGALALFGVALAILSSDGAPKGPALVTPPAAEEVEDAEASDKASGESAGEEDKASKTGGAEEGSNTSPEVLKAGEADEQAVASEKGSTDLVTAPTPKASRPAPVRAAPKRLAIKTRAPKGVRWKLRGRRLGKGSGTVRVPPGTTSLQAYHPQTGGTSTVPIAKGVADFGSVGTGTLDVRVRPWAKVKLGSKSLGATPIQPMKLPAGKYIVTFTWNDKTKKLPVTLKRGGRASLKVDMRK